MNPTYQKYKDNKPAIELRAEFREELNLTPYFSLPLPRIFNPTTMTMEEVQTYGHARFQKVDYYYNKIVTKIKKLSASLKRTRDKRKCDQTYKTIQHLAQQLFELNYDLQIMNYLDNVYKSKYYAIVEVNNQRLTYGPYTSQSTMDRVASGETTPSKCKLVPLNNTKCKEMKWEK